MRGKDGRESSFGELLMGSKKMYICLSKYIRTFVSFYIRQCIFDDVIEFLFIAIEVKDVIRLSEKFLS